MSKRTMRALRIKEARTVFIMLNRARHLCGLYDQFGAMRTAEERARRLRPSCEEHRQTDCDKHLACKDDGGGAYKHRCLRRSDTGADGRDGGSGGFDAAQRIRKSENTRQGGNQCFRTFTQWAHVATA